MEYNKIEWVYNVLPLLAIGCWLAAIFFFRKDEVPATRILLPFMVSVLSPARMKEELTANGIALLIIGYIFVIIWLFI